MTSKTDDLEGAILDQISQLIPQQLSIMKKLIKFSKRKLEQERIMAISRSSIYNVSKKKLKRTINVLTIEGISISSSSSEFTLHIPSEFDVRYKSVSRDRIIYQVLKNREVMGDKTRIPLFIVDSGSLDHITTTEQDVKKGKRKSVQAEHQLVNHYTFGLYIYKQFNSVDNSQILYVSEDHLSLCAQRDYVKLMRIGNSEVCDTEVIKCSRTKEVLTSKSFNKRFLAMDVQAFREIVEKHRDTKHSEKLLMVREKPNEFQLVFEYYQGDMYGQLKAQTTLHQEHLLHIAIRLIFAIHEQQSIISTLNPENILYDSRGNPKLSMLGSYFKATSPDQYCSPQQIQFYLHKTPILHPKMVNVWRLGVTLYELAYGVPPFPFVEIVSAVTNKREFTLKFPRIHKSKQFQMFLQSILRMNPESRAGCKNMLKLFTNRWFQEIDVKNYDQLGIHLNSYMAKIELEDNYSETIKYYYNSHS